MIDRQQLLNDLQRLLPKVEQDILTYSESKPDLHSHLKQEYAKAKEAHRTAEHFVFWREVQITQAAVAWILTCVFVRFLEDNELLDEPMIAGPAGVRLQRAKDRLTVYYREHPTHAEREYLLNLFETLEQYPVMAELLDHRHNPLWQLPVSADGAKEIIDFFQQLNPETGEIIHDFTDSNWDTRFLGDLYQDLSESVRKRYALLQTPEFVESFILDYTLEKAKDTFGLPGLRLIDPTCGSGHFLLTSFERLFYDWIKREPTTNARALAQRALDSVYGVDINPYAIAVARFRLLIAAMKVAGSDKVKDAPDFHFNLAVGDSLLHGQRHESQGQGIQSQLMDDRLSHVFDVEDKEKLEKILGQRYHAVVGNPPYITVKDKALNQAYRDKYPTCLRKYSLGVPFTERFFDLTLPDKANHPSGYIGMITANSFMKREFGKTLIEEYLPKKNLTHVIDTSGAYIPGHGTPTVILFARNSQPQNDQVRAVLGNRGEPKSPENPTSGKVWCSIVEMLDRVGTENDFIRVVDRDRTLLSSHPWSVGVGAELKEILDENFSSRLGDFVEEIGFGVITGEDGLFVDTRSGFDRANIVKDLRRTFVEGDVVREWGINSNQEAIFPYDEDINVVGEKYSITHKLWPYNVYLCSRLYFGKNQIARGLAWYEYGYISKAKNRAKLLIPFAFVSTHNHFVLDRGGKVFKQSAPVIKLPAKATETDHLMLLGLLNSSIACFWMKQVFHNKGDSTDSRGARVTGDPAFDTYEFTGTGLKEFPIPENSKKKVQALAQELDRLAQQLADLNPTKVLERTDNQITAALSSARMAADTVTRKMIALQEELDWLNYRLYEIEENDLSYLVKPPEIQLGERPFEIRLARRMVAGKTESTWFQRHNSRPVTEIPSHWPADYRVLVERRLQVMEENRWIKLVEQPEYKRRWNQESWEKRQERALKDWLLDHLEKLFHASELLTCAQLADRTRNDEAFQQVSALYTGTDTFDAQALVSELIAGNNVPQMAAVRYKPKAIPKFRAW
ncbi:MAG: BREX-2 system adenine-specific DNA-methyltransferase PglX [Candidatus Thiodiazotropha sp.]